MIAISGASGGLGRRVAELVLAQADPTQVVLLTRTPDRLKDLARRGARVEKASFKNPTGLKQVLAGVERLLLISTDAVGARVDQHRQAIAAARSAGVWQVAYTSVAQPSADNPALVAVEHAQTEQALRESGMAWTMLRNNLYADGLLPAVQAAAASGVWVTNAGEGRTAYVTREDCARAAAAVLLTDGHEKESYDITGQQALTQAEVVELAAQVTGQDIVLIDQPDDEYAASLTEAGLPAPAVELVVSFGEAVRSGFLSKCTDDVRALTGTPAQSVKELLSGAAERGQL